MVKERVITVEYLEPTMSSHLLHKFPDNSAYDFDYTQSGIWSPLLPRGSAATATATATTSAASAGKRPLRREERDKAKEKKLSKLKGKIRKKLAKKGLGFLAGSSPSPAPAPKKAWSKALKAAARCFTRERRRASILSSADASGFIELS